jgi:hypothetical protein
MVRTMASHHAEHAKGSDAAVHLRAEKFDAAIKYNRAGRLLSLP